MSSVRVDGPQGSADRTAARSALRASRRRATRTDLLATLVTVVLALMIGFLATLAVGENPIDAYRALLTGPLTRSIRIGRWLEDGTTITLLALSVAIPFRANQISLGAEGQIFAGALCSGLVALNVPLPPVLAMVVPVATAACAGFAIGLIPGMMKAYWGANEIVSTLMLNAIVVRVYAWVLTSFLTVEGASVVASKYLPEDSRFTSLTALFDIELGRSNIALLLVPVLAAAVWVLLQRTPFGYEVRMVGSNSAFAAYGGIASKRVVAMSFAVGGAIAGMVGAHLVQGTNGRLLVGLSAGLGFEGIVVALLAHNNPLIIPIAGFGYSYLRVGGEVMEQEASVGTEIVSIIQAMVILLVTAQVAHSVLRRRRNRMAGGSPDPSPTDVFVAEPPSGELA